MSPISLPLLLLIHPLNPSGPGGTDDVHGSGPVRITSFAKVPRPVKLFFPQTTLEEWALADQADVAEHALVLTGDTVKYPVSRRCT